VALEDLEQKCSPSLNQYIIGSVDLIACLCMGRNAAVVSKFVSKNVPLAMVMAALRLPRLNAGLRAAFANVLLHTYIDQDPQKVRPPVSFTRVWLHLDKSLVTTTFTDEFGSVKKLCQLFLEHVNEKDSQLPGFSLLLFRMLNLVLRMFEFGIYQEVNEIQDMLPHLSRVLGLKSQSRAMMRGTRDTDMMLIEAKLTACQVLDKILYFRLNAQITKLLVILRELLEVRVTQSMDTIVSTVLARLSFENEDHMQKGLETKKKFFFFFFFFFF
jgi:hypothetical protein